MRELATARPRFGYERRHILLTREGWRVGHNRVHRLYKLEGLQVRMRVRRRKRISLHRGPAPAERPPVSSIVKIRHRTPEHRNSSFDCYEKRTNVSRGSTPNIPATQKRGAVAGKAGKSKV